MKRAAEEAIVPTLGHVAAEDRFEPIRQLISSVKDTPVTELGLELRSWLKGNAGAVLLVALAFLDACDARTPDAATKRSRVGRVAGELSLCLRGT
jgi:hypothetical protein